MTSSINSGNYNRKVDFVIYWLGKDTDAEKNRISRLVENNLCVLFFHTLVDFKQALKEQNPDLIIVSSFSDYRNDMTIGAEAKENHSAIFMLITEKLNKKSRELFYQLGGDQLMIDKSSFLELYFRIRHIKLTFDQRNNSGIQVEEASQMALLAMENSSDLGAIISFVKAATQCHNYESLAQCILDAVNSYSDSAIIEMKGAEKLYFFGSEEAINSDLKQEMLTNKNDTRIVRFDNAFQINHDHLVLLVEGLPIDDVARMGRIADNLAILADTADRFVLGLYLQEKVVISELVKTRFISSISHELNTPMNAIQGFSKIISKKKENDVIGKKELLALTKINENSLKMKSIIETLNDLTEDNGKKYLSEDEIDVDNLIVYLHNRCALDAENKKLKILLPQNCNIQFKGDQKHIKKMLFNLIDNAIKFTNDGEVELSVILTDDEKIGDAIRFIIRDTGIGISDENISNLFNTVGQLNIEHDRSQYGAGLGLYYVHSFSKQLDGDISAKSVVNEGSVFTLTLPTHSPKILDNVELF